MFAALRECNPPFFENSPGVFTDNYGQCSPCPAGERWSTAAGLCVLDTVVDVTSPPPATADSNFIKYAAIGLGLILLLGAFAGGRASKSSGIAPGTRKRVTKSFWVTF